MKVWLTEIKAINPQTGSLTTWGGPNVVAANQEKAEQFCQENELGYCKVVGVLLEEVEYKEPQVVKYSLN